MKKTKLLIAALLGSTLLVQGQIVVYNFTTGPDEDPVQVANVSATDISAEGAATSFSSANFGSDFANEPYARVNGNWTALTPSAGGIVQFTVTPANGFQLDVTTITFDVSATGAGPDSISISTDGGSSFTSLLTDFQGTDATPVSHTVSDSFTTDLVVQISGFAGGTGNMDIDTIAVNGSVSVVPEPSTYAALLGLVGLVYVALRRRRK